MATASVHSGYQSYWGYEEEEDRQCRSCRSTALRVDWPAGDRVCTDCGVVDAERLLDARPEWRTFEDEAPTAPVRSGLVSTNEQKWIGGGLQPTTLSQYIYGGANPQSARARKTLLKCQHKTDRQFEKKHARELKEARLLQAARKRQRKEDAGRPDSLLEIDEEDRALVHSATLYAQKWNLTRCLLLCGTPQEQSSAQTSSSRDDDAKTLADLRDASHDSVLVTAARELYRAYSILMRTGLTLKLPDRLVHDAASFLAAYAARKDGLSVKGVARYIKRQQPQYLSPTARQAAQADLREFNALRQSAALSVAFLFYTARRQGHFRPLNEVYQSLPAEVMKAKQYADWTQGGPLIKTKQCAKAMAQVKEFFPDLATNPGLPEQKAQTKTSSGSTAAPTDTVSVQNYVFHVTQSLQLPPVAIACVQTLVQQASTMSEQDPLPLRTASFTYFLALVGQTMQKLAAQSQPKSRKRSRLMKTFRKPETTKKNAIGIQTPIQSEIVSSMDEALSSIAEEEQAYQMQRMWSAWKDQTPWWRSLPEISKSIQVPAHKIRDHYLRKIHPQRHALLKQLSETKTDEAPLCSVLLPHISLAAPLLKDS